jgi:transaldolase
MSTGYFLRVAQETPTRFWINNPTGPDADRAIAAGAISCTTNPSYCSKLIGSEGDFIHGLIDRAVSENDNDDEAAAAVYDRAALRILRRFLPLYEASHGAYGYVTVQDDPRSDNDPEAIVGAALRGRAMGNNYMAKIPVTQAGAQAIERLVAHDVPICATEIFSIAQAVHICELYNRAAEATGKHPPFYVTHITGIFDQYLAETARSQNIAIAPQVLAQAGCSIARKEYQLIKERDFRATMLGGGARADYHFTEMVGGDIHVTINWSTAASLIAADGPVVSRIDVRTPQAILEELSGKLPDFRKAYDEDGLSPVEFAEFGPLLLFRGMFVAGYAHLLGEIAARRGTEKKA